MAVSTQVIGCPPGMYTLAASGSGGGWRVPAFLRGPARAGPTERKALLMARPNLPLPALTREFADRIAELPDEVKAAWEKPRPTANSRVYAVHQIAQGIVYDGASIRHWIEQRWPGEAEVFRERLESLRRAITGGSVREKADAILCSLEPDFDHLKLLAELLPKYLRELAGEMEAEPDTDTVTLSQAAALVNRSKRTLEGYRQKDTTFPAPCIKGKNGKADEWAWAELRPWLVKTFKRPLPDRFPRLRK